MTGRHLRPRRRRRLALFAVPAVAAAVVVLGVTGTLAQLTASITNNQNHVQAGTVGLTEDDPATGTTCTEPENGVWGACDNINKYGGATLASGGSTGQVVTLTNTGTVAATLVLLPSACSDTLTGAGGALCDLVSVTVTCTTGVTVGPVTLNALFSGRNQAGTSPPSGYAMGTIPAGQTASCTFDLTAGTIPPGGGSISQPLAWKLTGA